MTAKDMVEAIAEALKDWHEGRAIAAVLGMPVEIIDNRPLPEPGTVAIR